MLSSHRAQQLALIATQALCEGSAFVRNLILARLIGADEMGLAVLLALVIRIFEMAGEMGLDRLLVQVRDRELSSVRKSVHWLQLIKGALLAAVAILLAAPITRMLNPALDPSMFAVAALALLIRGASNLEFRERQRRGEYVPALVVEGGSALIAAVVCAPLAWALRDHTTLAWVLLVQAGTFCTLSHLYSSSRYRLDIDRTLFVRCLRYGGPIMLNGALMFLALQGDRLVVSLFFPPAELARFALAAQLALLPALIGARFLLAYELPRFARLARETAGFGEHHAALLYRVSLVSLIGALGLGMGGNALVAWLYGDVYTVAPALFWLLAAGAGIRLIRAVPGTALMALERTHLLLFSNLPRLMTVALAFWAAAHGGGLTAVAAIAVCGEGLSLLIALAAIGASGGEKTSRTDTRVAEGI